MTQTELLDTIRREVERRIKHWHCAEFVDEMLEGPNGDDGFLSFLDTLQEPSLPEGLDEVRFDRVQAQHEWFEGNIADTDNMDHNDYEKIAEHYFNLGKKAGAEWMAGQDIIETVYSLIDAIERYVQQRCSRSELLNIKNKLKNLLK